MLVKWAHFLRAEAQRLRHGGDDHDPPLPSFSPSTSRPILKSTGGRETQGCHHGLEKLPPASGQILVTIFMGTPTPSVLFDIRGRPLSGGAVQRE